MKLTLSQVFGLKATLDKLRSMTLVGKSGFKVARFVRPLMEVFTDIEQQRNALVIKYGAPLPGGDKDHVEVKKESMEDFVKELNELFSQEVEVVVEPLKAELIEQVIEVNDILLLGDLVVE